MDEKQYNISLVCNSLLDNKYRMDRTLHILKDKLYTPLILPHKIYRNIGEFPDFSLEGFGWNIASANEERIVFEHKSEFKKGVTIGVIIANSILLFFICFCLYNIFTKGEWWYIFFLAFLSYLEYWCGKMMAILFYQRNFIDTYTFDRIAGTVTYPQGSFKPYLEKFSFDKCNFSLYLSTAHKSPRCYQLLLKIEENTHDTSSGDGYILTFTRGNQLSEGDKEALFQLHSYFIWYMDKNRPLPPGPFSEESREKDEERRKSAGSLPPLYPLTN